MNTSLPLLSFRPLGMSLWKSRRRARAREEPPTSANARIAAAAMVDLLAGATAADVKEPIASPAAHPTAAKRVRLASRLSLWKSGLRARTSIDVRIAAAAMVDLRAAAAMVDLLAGASAAGVKQPVKRSRFVSGPRLAKSRRRARARAAMVKVGASATDVKEPIASASANPLAAKRRRLVSGSTRPRPEPPPRAPPAPRPAVTTAPVIPRARLAAAAAAAATPVTADILSPPPLLPRPAAHPPAHAARNESECARQLDWLWSTARIGVPIADLNAIIAAFVAGPRPIDFPLPGLRRVPATDVFHAVVADDLLCWISSRHVFSAPLRPLLTRAPLSAIAVKDHGVLPLSSSEFVEACLWNRSMPSQLWVVTRSVSLQSVLCDVDLTTRSATGDEKRRSTAATGLAAGALATDEPPRAARRVPLPDVGPAWTTDGRGGLLGATRSQDALWRFDLATGAVSHPTGHPFEVVERITYMCFDPTGTRLFVTGYRRSEPPQWYVLFVQNGVKTVVYAGTASVTAVACLPRERLLMLLLNTVDVLDLPSGQRHTYAAFDFPAQVDDQFVRDMAIDERSRTAILVRPVGCFTLNIAPLLP
jgi:hypothetical protein